ncbi:MAG: hypothetical protein NC225_10610 [Clostridium sp.]|nr:hypothetical protein [Clostridium sp.]MCM1460719.1 hypothetical protein [Bacteroides sp.]
MENKKSLLNLNTVNIVPNLSVRIPSVGEILENEQHYYSVVSSLTTTPFQYMVQLDDMGIDYTTITEYELFKMLFPIYAQSDLSILFGDLNTSDFGVYTNHQDNTQIIYSPQNNIMIDEPVYHDFVDVIRKINLFGKVKSKPGNDAAKKYLLEKERKKQNRNARKPYEPYLEKLVIALVNTSEFPYDYNSCMDLSIYRFNQSLKQIQHKIAFDNTMIGVYAGTVDASKMRNKDTLSWIPNNSFR